MKPKMLSSVYGEITEILMVFPGIATEASEWEYEAITKIFDSKGKVHQFLQKAPERTIRVVPTSFRGNQDQENQEFKVILDNYRTVNQIAANLNLTEVLNRWRQELEQIDKGGRLSYSRWAQDPFVTLFWDDAIILLQSYYGQRLTDYLLPVQIAEQAGHEFLLKPTQLYLEGGNILCDCNRAFVGKDLIEENRRLLKWEEGRVMEKLKKDLGVSDIKVIGFAEQRNKWMTSGGEGNLTWQPFFHIDLFLTLGGKQKDSQKELIFFANSKLTTSILQQAKVSDPGICLPRIDPNLDDGLEMVKAGFPEDQFTVIDLPVFCYDGTCYSWNNCLMEVTQTSRKVYLPTYHVEIDEQCLNPTFKVLEADVTKRFTDAGFECVPIPSGKFFRIIASHGGSLHCVVKVLRRKPYCPCAT